MAQKQNGNTRAVTPETKAIEKSKSDFYRAIETGNFSYSSSLSVVFDNGGYLLFHKDREYNEDEHQAALKAAKNGYQITMNPEKGKEFVLKSYKGKDKYGDGLISAEPYEQSTKRPEGGKLYNAIKNAIKHAREKGATVALIYDVDASFHRAHIKKGLEEYEKFVGNSPYQPVEWVLVITKDGRAYEWYIEK